MSILAVGLGLAKFVPDIIGWFAGDKAKDASEKVLSIAESVTGIKLTDGNSEDDIIRAIESDPNLALQFKTAVLKQKNELDKIYLADRSNAREMYSGKNETADNIAKSIIRWNLLFVFGLVLLQIFSIDYLGENPEQLVIVANVVGYVINGLLTERQSVTSFFFGSSLGSKMKSAMGMK